MRPGGAAGSTQGAGPARRGEPANDELLTKAIDNYKKAAEIVTEPLTKQRAMEYLVAAYGPDKLNEPSEAEPILRRMIELDPNEADTWATLSDIAVLAGRVEEGLEHIRKAFRLNPHPASWYYLTLGQAQYAAGEYEAAVETLRRDETYRTSSRRFLAASLAQLGRLDEAHTEAELFLVANPGFTIRHWAATEPFRDDATLAHFVDGFRKAGLPE